MLDITVKLMLPDFGILLYSVGIYYHIFTSLNTYIPITTYEFTVSSVQMIGTDSVEIIMYASQGRKVHAAPVCTSNAIEGQFENNI